MTTLESYRYSALDDSGNKISGTEKAASASAAHLMLIHAAYSRSTSSSTRAS